MFYQEIINKYSLIPSPGPGAELFLWLCNPVLVSGQHRQDGSVAVSLSLSLSQSDINFIEVSSWSGTVTALIVWTQKYSTMKLNSANDENFGSLKPVGSGLFYQSAPSFVY